MGIGIHSYRIFMMREFLQSVRDYLGHAYEEMTQQYIIMPRWIEEASKAYFKGNRQFAVCWIERGGSMEEVIDIRTLQCYQKATEEQRKKCTSKLSFEIGKLPTLKLQEEWTFYIKHCGE